MIFCDLASVIRLLFNLGRHWQIIIATAHTLSSYSANIPVVQYPVFLVDIEFFALPSLACIFCPCRFKIITQTVWVTARLGAACSEVRYVFRLACQTVDELCWRCRRFIFRACRNSTSVFVGRNVLNGKLIQTCRQTTLQNLSLFPNTSPSSFFWSACVFLWRERKKITAAWHQVWKSLPPNSILTFNSCSPSLFFWKRRSLGGE